MARFLPAPHRRQATIVAVVALAMLGVRWMAEHSPEPPAPAGETAPEVATAPLARLDNQADDTQEKIQPAASVDLLASDPIPVGNQATAIRLALDEAIRREPTGKESLLRLNPPATVATLPTRLAALSTAGMVLPVAYLDGLPRSTATRRVVTNKLRLMIEASAVAQLTARHQLTIHDRPEHAPGWIIASAADPFAALNAMAGLRGQLGVAAADVLLATQQSRKSLPNDPLISAQWHLKNANTTRTHANVEPAWNYGISSTGRGAGIRIGIVDDGLETAHPDLAPNVDVANDKDWNGGDADPNPETDDDHGTACAGNAAARGNNNLGVAGTAPEATLVGLRLISGSTDDAMEAEAIAYRNDLIAIKSNSWGPEDTGTLVEGPGPLTLAALQSAATTGRNGKGTIFLWAGGNGGDVGDNSNYDGYANSIYTIAIGATDSNGLRADYSEPGSNLVVCAPSDGAGTAIAITTTDRTGFLGYNIASSASGGDYATDFGGTSSATPTAAGIVALMLEKNPDLGWRDVQEILIRSAYPFKPTDSGWAINGANLRFHHDFGAGLIDAAAAVNLAATWTNLKPQTATVSTQSGLTASIPDNNATGISRSFDLTASNLRVEHATVKLNISHTARGNLEITLTSPSGMTSRLAATHSDSGNDFSNWTFMSVRHWGETSTGTWTLKIADRSTSGNTVGGTLTSAELTLFGTTIPPVNPAPLAQITQPSSGQVFSPGASVTVQITASDLTAAGTPGTISQVELLDNNLSIGTTSTAPYAFTFTPAIGSHTLVAKATDSEAAIGTSGSITFQVANQAPTIVAADLNALSQAYADTDLTVAVSATDPEGDPLSFSYQWQASTDGSYFSPVPAATSATLPADPSHAAKLWRCLVTASDGQNLSAPVTTAVVNLLPRPPLTATAGAAYQYASGLVLRGNHSQLSRAALINEISQGSSASAEWVEIVTLQTASFRSWSLADNSSSRLTFTASDVWDAIPAGTLIVIYNSAAKDPLLPPDDNDPADGRMILASSNSTFFIGTWPSFADTGDAVVLRDSAAAVVSSISYGNESAFMPNVGTVNTAQGAYFAGDNDAAANTAASWVTTAANTSRKTHPRATSELFISEYVEGSNLNKAIEIYNPTTAPVNLATAAYALDIYSNGATLPSFSIPLTGTVAAASTYVVKHLSASALIPAQQPSSSLSYNGNDTLVLRKGTTHIDCFGQIGFNPGTAWAVNGVSTQNQTLRRKPTVTQGDAIATDAFDPSTEWLPFDIDDFSGIGSHTLSEPLPALTLNVAPATFAENAGLSAAVATLSIATPLAANLTISLNLSPPTLATAPSSVVIPSGETSVSFGIAAVDDDQVDGSQSLTLTATAEGFLAAEALLTVTDDESPPGVTPAAPNTPANQTFVTGLRNGAFITPSLFRLGATAQIPPGLILDPATGVLAGTLAPTTAAGDYPVVIERYNTLGEVVSQAFVLTVSSAPSDAFTAYLEAAGVPTNQRGPSDDPDHDGQTNLIEFALGGHPNNPASRAINYSWLEADASPEMPGDLLLTIAVRAGTPAFSDDPAPSATADGVTYTVQGSADLTSFTTAVQRSSPVTTLLPPAPTGYEYRTFRLPRAATGFLRVRITTD